MRIPTSASIMSSVLDGTRISLSSDLEHSLKQLRDNVSASDVSLAGLGSRTKTELIAGIKMQFLLHTQMKLIDRVTDSCSHLMRQLNQLFSDQSTRNAGIVQPDYWVRMGKTVDSDNTATNGR